MTDPEQRREYDLALLAAGQETGWWDGNGVPAPWPDDFFDDRSGWRPSGSDEPPVAREPGEPPF
jgi:hypothetical protein